MKKSMLYIIAASALLLSSCNDLLDKSPRDTFTNQPSFWINENYRLADDEAVDKRDPLVVELKNWIDAEYESGRQTSLSTGELEEKIEELSGGRFSRL